jgi:putative hydroxymethylpyrimidine transport system substrate-binding protein
MKRLLIALALLALPVALAACGEKSETVTPSSKALTPLTVMLDWFPNADHVGIYQALAEGDFKRAGLDVHVQVPSNPASPLQLLAAGKVDVAVSYEPEVLLARNQNLPLVSIGAIVQQPLTSIISIGKHPIRRAAELQGKTVGDAGISYQHAYLQTIENYGHVPKGSVKEINVGANLVPALLSGRVNAILGGYWNYEAIQLAQMKKHPYVIHMNQVGVPSYDELVLVTRASMIEKHGAPARQRPGHPAGVLPRGR